MSDPETRRQLLQTVDRDEAELERALVDLKRAAARPFAIGTQLREHVVAHPLPWLAAALLVGVWLGRRRA
jgi:hypothetical protein